MKKQKTTMRLLHTPDLFLRVKGRLDARHGQSTCDAFINGKLRETESRSFDALTTLETAMQPLYEESTAIAIVLTESDAGAVLERDLPQDPASVAYLRWMRNVTNARTSQAAKQESAIDRLGKIDESILSAESSYEAAQTVLQQAVCAKLYCYIRGVRANKRAGLGQYRETEPFVFSDAAFQRYREIHRPNTTLRRSVLEERLNKRKEM